MDISSKRSYNRMLAGLAILFVWLSLLAWRLIAPKPGLDAHGAAIWTEIVFLVLLYVFVHLAGFGLGRIAVRYFAFPSLTRFEANILACVLGFGILSAGMMALGFAGWLNRWTIFLWMAVSGVLAMRELLRLDIRSLAFRFPKIKSPFLVLLQVIALAAVPLLLVEGFSPVWDYDALLYHLEGPRQFLAQGKFIFDPEVLRSAYPYLGEMLFAVGLAFDLTPLARLVNFNYAILFVLSSYVFSRRFLGVNLPTSQPD